MRAALFHQITISILSFLIFLFGIDPEKYRSMMLFEYSFYMSFRDDFFPAAPSPLLEETFGALVEDAPWPRFQVAGI